ncbi:Uncharacterized protein M6B38_241640 [Iris pallida]|uniref:Uncharacterized protein n=1 Tax=Iris pallida TaxID=29817 RepID=A0AAX6DJD5_IRIPA|nr:Uncharacterized protein M6B38_241640 [Iris pallida]
MSLALIQSYSSEEEEEKEKDSSPFTESEDEEEEYNNGSNNEERNHRNSLLLPPPLPNPNPSSLLPSALDAFAEIAGPPAFLNNSVGPVEAPEVEPRGRNRSRREKKDLPAGVVVEAKPQLIGIRDRVRSDVEASIPAPAKADPTSGEGKRVVSVANPDAKDAADLLRMCLQCGVPKTFSHAQGVVCPICGDRPKAEPLKESDKKKGSTIKDKEKNKRMKGQSSHASWKSETEMHLRQQYD